MAAIPTPDLAVPYEAPKQVKTMAAVQPMAPKKGCDVVLLATMFRRRNGRMRSFRVAAQLAGSSGDN